MVVDDGVPPAVREVGPGDAPLTVVFLHGFCLRMSTWHFRRRDLAQAWADEAPRAVEAGWGAMRMLMAPVLTAGSFGSTYHSTAVIGVAECSHMVMMENLRAVNDAMSGLVGRVQRP